MGDAPFGVIEIILAFGAILAWAVLEVGRNRRAIKKSRDGPSMGVKDGNGPGEDKNSPLRRPLSD